MADLKQQFFRFRLRWKAYLRAKFVHAQSKMEDRHSSKCRWKDDLRVKFVKVQSV